MDASRFIEMKISRHRLYIADGEPHYFRKPSHRLFKINSDLDWFARHLNRPAYPPSLPEEALADKPGEGQ